MTQTPTLLLSATIEPRGMTQLTLSDPNARRKQYLSAVDYWLSLPVQASVVFVENSGADLADFRQRSALSAGRLEVIGLPHEPFPTGLGKGYGEFRMIDMAVEQSTLLKQADHFGKITGRLTIGNLPAMWRHLPREYDLIADAHLKPTQPNGGLIDSRLVFFSTAFYRSHAIGLYKTMNDGAGYFAEHAFFRLMQTAPATAKILTRLPIEPHWQGSSGSTGASYDDALSRVKRPLKGIRRLRDRWLNRPSLQTVRAATQAAPASA
ncbi:MAG: hypothetical protein JWM57_3599 [Phycisphaerales bacterium]|nr:hypothetical protein [Phycisphaerales bacterium]